MGNNRLMKSLALLMLLLVTGCSLSGERPALPPPPGAEVASGSPALEADPQPAPESMPPLEGSEPEAGASPAGPLTEGTWDLWTGPLLPWRAAVLGLLTRDGNPLELTAEENQALRQALLQRGVATEMLDFRLSRLYLLNPEQWPKSDAGPMGPRNQAPEELLLEQVEKVLPELAVAAGGAKAEAAPYPQALQEQRRHLESGTVPALDTSSEPPQWHQDFAEDASHDLRHVNATLTILLTPLEGQAAAQARAELLAMKEPLQELQESWTTLTRLATKTADREQKVHDLATEEQTRPVDMVQVNDGAARWMERNLR